MFVGLFYFIKKILRVFFILLPGLQEAFPDTPSNESHLCSTTACSYLCHSTYGFVCFAVSIVSLNYQEGKDCFLFFLMACIHQKIIFSTIQNPAHENSQYTIYQD